MTNRSTPIASLTWSTELTRHLEPGSGTTAVENLVSRLLAGELPPLERHNQGQWTWSCMSLPSEILRSGGDELLVVETICGPDDSLHVQVRLGADGSEPLTDLTQELVSR